MASLSSVSYALPLAVVVVVAYYIWEVRRSRTLLLRWASRQGVQIIRARRRWILKGPFFWQSRSGQVVFRVTVRGGNGVERTGWILCGNYVTGMATEQISEIWDKEGEPFSPSSLENQRQLQDAASQGAAEPHDDEHPGAAGRPTNTQLSPFLRGLIEWAARSPARMVVLLIGLLLNLVGLIFISYWLRFRFVWPWPAARRAPIGHYSEFVLAFTAGVVMIMYGAAMWSVHRQRNRMRKTRDPLDASFRE